MKQNTKTLILVGGVGAAAIFLLMPRDEPVAGFGGGGGAPILPILPDEPESEVGDIIYNFPAAVESAFAGFDQMKKPPTDEAVTTPKKEVSEVSLAADVVGDTDTITERLEKFLLPGESLEGFIESSVVASQRYPLSKKGHDVASLYFKPSGAGLKDPSVVTRAVTTTREAQRKQKTVWDKPSKKTLSVEQSMLTQEAATHGQTVVWD